MTKQELISKLDKFNENFIKKFNKRYPQYDLIPEGSYIYTEGRYTKEIYFRSMINGKNYKDILDDIIEFVIENNLSYIIDTHSIFIINEYIDIYIYNKLAVDLINNIK